MKFTKQLTTLCLLNKIYTSNYIFRWGRRTSFFIILFLEVNLSILTAFSPNYIVYTILRTINGLFFPAIYQIPFILGKYISNYQILYTMGQKWAYISKLRVCFVSDLNHSLKEVQNLWEIGVRWSEYRPKSYRALFKVRI
jgi:hypothetical protein